jgi:Tfp pilus assembly protein PilO
MNARNSRIGFSLALAGLVLGYAQFGVRPTLRTNAVKRAHILATRSEIAKCDNFTRGLEDLPGFLSDFATALAELDRLVPKSSDADARVADVTTLADRAGLTVALVRPDPAEPRGDVTAHPLTIKLRGTYLALERFLYEVEGLSRHSRITRADIARSESTTEDGDVSAEIELTSYSLPPTGAGDGS